MLGTVTDKGVALVSGGEEGVVRVLANNRTSAILLSWQAASSIQNNAIPATMDYGKIALFVQIPADIVNSVAVP
jgi:hypothetical protein